MADVPQQQLLELHEEPEGFCVLRSEKGGSFKFHRSQAAEIAATLATVGGVGPREAARVADRWNSIVSRHEARG